jgi:hypothetical protein
LITWVPTADGVDHLGVSLRVWVGLLGFAAGLGRVVGPDDQGIPDWVPR